MVTQYFSSIKSFVFKFPFYDSLGVKCPSCQVYVPLNLNVKVKCLRKDIFYTYNIFHGLNDRRIFLKPFKNMYLGKAYTYNIFHGLNDRRRFLEPFMNMHL